MWSASGAFSSWSECQCDRASHQATIAQHVRRPVQHQASTRKACPGCSATRLPDCFTHTHNVARASVKCSPIACIGPVSVTDARILISSEPWNHPSTVNLQHALFPAISVADKADSSVTYPSPPGLLQRRRVIAPPREWLVQHQVGALGSTLPASHLAPLLPLYCLL